MNLLLSFFMVAAPPLTSVEKAGEAKMLQQERKAAAISRPKEPASNSIMIITPKDRADDLQKAFQILRDEKSTAKVYFDLAGGKKISNVIEMKAMPGNTLILFRYSTPQGIKFEVASVEDILGIFHQ